MSLLIGVAPTLSEKPTLRNLTAQGVSNPKQSFYTKGPGSINGLVDILFGIEYDCPILLSLSNHPYLGNHVVVAWGYSRDGNTYFFLANDGHGDNYTYISYNYITGYMNLNDYSH